MSVPIRSSIRRACAAALPCLLALLSAPAAQALASSGAVGDVRYTVYAPDWTWQGREINVMVVLRNEGLAEASVALRLILPPEKEAFSYKGAADFALTVAPDSVERFAFTGVTPLTGHPRGVYRLALMVESGGEEARVEYPLRTIRGAVVSPGKWAVFLPALVALAWCAVFFLALRPLAPQGAWLVPAAPIPEPETKEPWIHQSPT